jgi:hypothetical protein
MDFASSTLFTVFGLSNNVRLELIKCFYQVVRAFESPLFYVGTFGHHSVLYNNIHGLWGVSGAKGYK